MRKSGILAAVFSLPNEYGIGCFSKEAYDFVDFLAESNQKFWQILPLGPTGYGDSPYQSFSTFAGNPYYIDLQEFVDNGWLSKEECDEAQRIGRIPPARNESIPPIVVITVKKSAQPESRTPITMDSFRFPVFLK